MTPINAPKPNKPDKKDVLEVLPEVIRTVHINSHSPPGGGGAGHLEGSDGPGGGSGGPGGGSTASSTTASSTTHTNTKIQQSGGSNMLGTTFLYTSRIPRIRFSGCRSSKQRIYDPKTTRT